MDHHKIGKQTSKTEYVILNGHHVLLEMSPSGIKFTIDHSGNGSGVGGIGSFFQTGKLAGMVKKAKTDGEINITLPVETMMLVPERKKGGKMRKVTVGIRVSCGFIRTHLKRGFEQVFED